MTQESRKPDFYIHAKVANGRSDRIGPRIGVGFKHGQGEGLNIILDAQPIPLDGRISLVGFAPQEAEDQFQNTDFD